MSFNNYGNYPQYQQGHQPNYQPYQPLQRNQPYTNIEYVNGVENAKSMPMYPNSVKLFLDSELPQFYIKRTDNEGRASIQVYQFTDTNKEEKKAEFVSIQQFNDLKSEFEQIKSLLKLEVKNEQSI
jgi:hypothetical protein